MSPKFRYPLTSLIYYYDVVLIVNTKQIQKTRETAETRLADFIPLEIDALNELTYKYGCETRVIIDT